MFGLPLTLVFSVLFIIMTAVHTDESDLSSSWTFSEVRSLTQYVEDTTEYSTEESTTTEVCTTSDIVPPTTVKVLSTTIPTTTTEVYTETLSRENFNYSESDLDLLSRLIYAEGGSTSYSTQLKIGSVVLNRVNRSDFNNSIYSVIYESGQFTVASGSNPAINKRPSQTSINAAREVLTNGSVLPTDVVYFYGSYVRDQWINTRSVYGVFDGVAFAYVY